jgi:hypothetical protein
VCATAADALTAAASTASALLNERLRDFTRRVRGRHDLVGCRLHIPAAAATGQQTADRVAALLDMAGTARHTELISACLDRRFPAIAPAPHS